MKGMIKVLKLSSLLDTIQNCDNINEINKSLWIMDIMKQALEQKREELVIEKIKNLKLEVE
jgi:hypothetical protein